MRPKVDQRRTDEQGKCFEVNEQFAARGSDFRLLTGTEVDILKDRLDIDDDVSTELERVVASLHVLVEKPR